MPNCPPFYKFTLPCDLQFVREYVRHAQVRILSSVLIFRLVTWLMIRYDECGLDEGQTDLGKIISKLRRVAEMGARQWLREFETALKKNGMKNRDSSILMDSLAVLALFRKDPKDPSLDRIVNVPLNDEPETLHESLSSFTGSADGILLIQELWGLATMQIDLSNAENHVINIDGPVNER